MTKEMDAGDILAQRSCVIESDETVGALFGKLAIIGRELLLEEDYENITIIDWYKYAKGEKQLFYKDATHPKPEGAKAYAEFILESIKAKK